jgi:hypothetical protein
VVNIKWGFNSMRDREVIANDIGSLNTPNLSWIIARLVEDSQDEMLDVLIKTEADRERAEAEAMRKRWKAEEAEAKTLEG